MDSRDSTPRIKRVWKNIDGVLLLDKPQGMTSNDALQKARRLFSAAKGGHTGTLDPMATGLLPICFGEATKFSADLLDAEKTYETVLQLGQTTDTGDAEGQVIETRPVQVEVAQIASVLQRFTGECLQIPPMYSALKRDGRPLYELARQGKTVERESRRIRIAELECLAWDPQENTLRLRVTCSKGTYIRVLGEDIGAALGCGAHLIVLRRTQVAQQLTLSGAVTLEALAEMSEDRRMAVLGPVDSLLSGLPPVVLEPAGADRFSHGNPVRVSADAGSLLCRVYGPQGRLLGTGRFDEQGLVWPKRLMKQEITPSLV